MVAGYRIERLLGQGGMGAVFQAYDTKLHRRAALKVLGAPAGDDSASARLLREARSAAALNHPGICTIYEVGEVDGSAFIAMEYVEGLSLRERLDARTLPFSEAVQLAQQIADALAYAHEHGVIHRDLKAANIIVTSGGRVKIVDFGLARRFDPMIAAATTAPTLAGTGAIAGTPYAMAPEQVRGASTDARTDIWAFGVLLCEMTTGRPPFTGASLLELFSSILRDPPLCAAPAEIRPIVEQCLAKDPAERYQRAEEICTALEAIHALPLPSRPGADVRWRRRFVIASAATLLVAVSLLLGFDVGRLRDRLFGAADDAARSRWRSSRSQTPWATPIRTTSPTDSPRS